MVAPHDYTMQARHKKLLSHFKIAVTAKGTEIMLQAGLEKPGESKFPSSGFAVTLWLGVADGITVYGLRVSLASGHLHQEPFPWLLVFKKEKLFPLC